MEINIMTEFWEFYLLFLLFMFLLEVALVVIKIFGW
jgi:hypothetical protein